MSPQIAEMTLRLATGKLVDVRGLDDAAKELLWVGIMRFRRLCEDHKVDFKMRSEDGSVGISEETMAALRAVDALPFDEEGNFYSKRQ